MAAPSSFWYAAVWFDQPEADKQLMLLSWFPVANCLCHHFSGHVIAESTSAYISIVMFLWFSNATIMILLLLIILVFFSCN